MNLERELHLFSSETFGSTCVMEQENNVLYKIPGKLENKKTCVFCNILCHGGKKMPNI